MLKIAPTLIVDRVEPSLEFLTKRLGFSKVMEVAGEGSLDFALLSSGEHEIHLQKRSSAGRDIPYLGGSGGAPSCFLYIDVSDVKALYEQLKDTEILVPLEKTFYGATHFFLREPGGHVLGFSQNGA
jgi:uncharacterized glyoxalase superfamily protein PhnB